MKRISSRIMSVIVSSMFLFAATASLAANGVWNGTGNTLWTNSANWSASTYPLGNDTASFTNSGNGQTLIDLAGLASIKNITFDTPAVAAYTNGTGAANSQTLVMLEGGEFKLTDTAANSQLFNCGVQLGMTRGGGTYTLTNANTAQTLTFNSIFGPVSAGVAGVKVLAVNGAGNTAILGDISVGGATSLTLTDNSSGTLTLSGSNVITTLEMNGGTNSVVDIGAGTLFLNNLGGRVLNCNQGGVIKGTGKIRLSTVDGVNSPGYNYADVNVANGKTLVINSEITGPSGFESNAGNGTFILNGTNTFEGHVNLATASPVSVFRVGNRGSIDSNLGKGTILSFGGTAKLIYTGTGETSDRQIILNNTGTIEQSGPAGKLTFSVTPMVSGESRALILQGSTAGTGEFTAPLVNNGAFTLSTTKAGEGTWILSGTNTYTGATTVNGGKLLFNSPGSSSGSIVTVNKGAILGADTLISGNVIVTAGGMLAPKDIASVGTMNLGGTLSLTSGTLLYDVSTTATDKVTVASALSLTGTNTVILSFPDGQIQAGSYTLMTFAALTGTGTFMLAPGYVNASLVTTATSLQLVVSGAGTYSKTWKGTVSGLWNTTEANWTNGSAAVNFVAGDAVLFDDTASTFNVGSDGSVQPGSVLFNNSNPYTVSAAMAGTAELLKLGTGTVTLSGTNTLSGQTTIGAGILTIGETGVLGNGNYATNLVNNGALTYASAVAQTNSGIISGGGSLTSSGSGMLTLSGNNTFAGPTTVTGGELEIRHANALGTTAAGTTVSAGAKLTLAGNIATPNEPLTLFGILSSQLGNNTYGGAITLLPGASIDVGAGSTNILSVSTTGSGVFTKTGDGLLRLTQDPNHTGTLTINGGAVELAANTTDGDFVINSGGTLIGNTSDAINGNNGVTVNAGGFYDLRQNDTIAALSGAGTVTKGTGGAATLTTGNALDQTFSGVIQNGLGTLSLVKNGTGALTLSGANTFSGGTTLSNGRLNINNSAALGTGALTIGGAYTLDNTSGANITLSPNNAQSWNGDFTFAGSKSLNLGTGAVTLNANRAITVLTNTLTVGGAVGGAFTLTKAGAGILTLSGANTYSGATTVNGGTLLVNGSTVAASAVTVNSGAILGGSGTINGLVNVAIGGLVAPGGVNATNTLTLANAGNALTLNGNTLLFDLPASGTACDKINITAATGKLVLNGANKIALSFPYGAAPAGDYILMTCTGGITTNGTATLALEVAYPGASLNMVGNNLVLTLGGDVSGLTWKGNLSDVWDNDIFNWTTNGAVAASYTAGDGVTFDDTATGNFIVSSVGTVSPASVLFNNSVNDYFITADLSGAGPLVKSGSDTATLFTGVSTYNPGSITVNDGTLKLGGASQLNSGVYAGTILNNGTLDFGSSATQTNSGIISGAGTLTVSGSGTLNLSGTNTYTGTTFVNAGKLQIQNVSGLGSAAAGTTVAQGATLEMEGNIVTLAEALNLFGTFSSQTGSNTYTGAITFQPGAIIHVGVGSTNIITASTTGTGAFTKTGGGLMKIMYEPNHNGVMTINEGTVEIAGSTMDSDTVINNGGTLIETSVGAINDANSVTINAGGIFDLRQNDTIAGFSGAGRVTMGITGAATLTAGGNNLSYTFSGVMENGLGTLSYNKAGAGTQTLTGTNAYTGATTVSGGTLLVNYPGSLSNSAVTVNVLCTLGGNGRINGTVSVTAKGYLAPGGLNTVGTLTLDKTLTLNGNTLLFDVSNVAMDLLAVTGALTINNVNTIALSFPDGAIPAGDYTLMTFASKTGAGSFSLAGSYPNTSLVYVGNTLVLRVTSGTISGLRWNGNTSQVWDGGSQNWIFGNTATNFVESDAVAFDDAATSFNVVSVGPVTPSSLFFNNTIANPYFVAANIQGTAPIVKIGPGAATLSGFTTYNPSAISLDAGTLVIGGAGQLNSGNYTVPIIINSGSFNHGSSATQILSGVISGGANVTKSGSGSLTLSTANTYSGGTTVSGGILYGGNVSSFGTAARALTIGNGTLDLATDTSINAHNTTVNGNGTIQSDRATSGAGITHTLGTLSIANQALYVRSGPNVSANSPYGLTFGTATMTAATPTFDVGNNGTGLGTLTLGALGGNFNFTKANSGTLFLGTISARAGGTATISGGTLKLGNASALGTLASTLTLNGGTVDLATDTPVNAYTTTVTATSTILSDRATSGAGITHTLGTLSIGNQTLSVTAGSNVSANSPYGLTFGAVTITGNTPTFDVANNGAGLGTLTLGAVGGAFNLTKAGGGTLILPGANTYSGTTTVNGGTLVINGSTVAASTVNVANGALLAGSGTINGKVSVAAGGMLAPGGLNATNTLTLANNSTTSLTLNGNTLFFDLPSVGTVGDKIDITGATGKLVLNGANKIALSFPYGATPAGTYTLMTCTGGITTNAGATLTLLIPYPNATLSVVGNNVVLTTTSTLGLTWKGYQSDVWDNGILNWTNATAAASFVAGDLVTFDDTALNFTVSSVNPVLPSSVLFNNNASNYTISASIGGTGPLTKIGSGTVTLSGTNNVTGGTTVNAGLLILTGTNTGGTAATTINSAGILQIGAGGTSGTLLGSGAVAIWANNGLQFNRIDPVSSPVIVNNKLSKVGGTYSIVVNSGAVQIGGIDDNNSNAADIKNGATLILAKPSSTGVHALGNNSLVENGGTMMLGGTGNYQIYLGLNLTVNSGGVMDLNSRNQDFTGGGGRIYLSGTGISNSGALINSSTAALSTLTMGANGLTLSDNSSIGGAGNITIIGIINGPTFGITKVGSGTLTLVSTNIYGGATLINNGRLVGVTGGSCAISALTVQSSGTGAKATLGVSVTDSTKQWTCASLTTAAGVLAGNPPGLEFVYYTPPSTSVAPLNVTGNVAFDGDTTITVDPANLVAGDYPLLVAGGTVPAITPAVTIGGGLTASVEWGKSPYSAQTLVLTVTGSSTSREPLRWNSTAAIWDVNNAANLVWKDNTGAVTNYQESVIGDAVVFDDMVTADTTVTLNSGVTPMSMTVSNSAYAYTISGSGAIAGLTGVTKDGNNMLTLATYNTYSGPTIISAGTLSVGVDNNLGSVPLSITPASILLGGGTLSANNTFTLAANRGITLTDHAALDVASTRTLTYGGVITGGALSLTKTGLGALQLITAANAYSGGTVIHAGTVQIGNNTVGNENVNALGTGTVTVNANGLLHLYPGGTGNVYAFANGFDMNGGRILGEDGVQRLATGVGATFNVGAAGGTVQAKYTGKDVYIDGQLTGSGPLTLSNPGGGTVSSVHITKAGNPYSGIVNVSGANAVVTLSLDHATALQSATVNLNPGTAGALLLNTGVGNTAVIAGLTGTAGTVRPNTTAGTYTLNVNNSSDFSYGGTFANNTGILALQKTGTGALTLSGTSTHTGATTVNNGKLAGVVGGSCASSDVTVAATTGNSATFEVSITDNTKQWTCSSLTLNNAGVSSGLDFNFGYSVAPSATVVPLRISNAATFTTPTLITIKAGNLPVSTGNGYPLMTWGGTGPTDLTGITLALPGHITGNLAIIGTTNYLQITANTQPLNWATSGAGDWSTNAIDTNWKDRNGTITAYSEATLPGDQVVFSDSNLVADATVTLNSTVTPASMTVSNVLYTYEISGSGGIAGPIGVTKSGTNTLTLGTANTYAGVTDLKGGILKLGNTSALPTGNTLSMTGTGTLDLNGYGPTLANISASATGNTITDTSAGVGTTDLSILNLATTVSALIKDGTAKAVAVSIMNNNASFSPFLTTAASTYSGGLLLKNGSSLGAGTRLRIMTAVTTVGTPGAITSSPFGKGPIIIGEAATDKAQILFDTVANNTVANEIIVNSPLGTDAQYALRSDTTGNTLSGAVKANSELTVGGAGALTINNEISGAGGVTVVSGTLTLNGANTYAGKTTVTNNAVLSVNSIGNVGGTSALGAPATASDGTIRLGSGGTGGTLSYKGMGATTDRIIALTGTTGGGTLEHSGTNLLKFSSNLLISGIGAKELRLQGLTAISTGEVAGVISDSPNGAVRVTKAGGAVWRLSGNNTFSGNVTVSTSILVVASSGALGVGNKTVLVNTGNSMPELHLDGSAGDIVLGTNILFETSNSSVGSIHNVKGTNTIMGSFFFTSGNGFTLFNSRADKLYMSGDMRAKEAGRELHLRGNGDGEISGVISNGATVNMPVLRDGGTGTWTLSGTNTYTGPTTISVGMLAAGSDQAFGTNNVVNLTGGNLGGAVGTWSIMNTVNAQSKADINTAGTLILAGSVTNNAALNKTGPGTLLVNGSKTGTGALTVSTGVFGGTGSVAGTVTNLATITAADTNSIGILTVTNLVMAANSTIIWNCNAVTQDVIKVTGALSLPEVATVLVNQETEGDIGLNPRVLFTFTTGPSPARLANWVIVGATDRTAVRVENKQVVLFRLPGTMIRIL